MILAIAVLLLQSPDWKEREVRDLVVEFIAESTTTDRRTELIGILRSVPRHLMQRTIIGALKDDKTRGLALDLATGLRVTGLLAELKKYAESVDEDRIVKLLLLTQDEGAAVWLYDRWAQAAPESASHRIIDEAFRKNGIADAGVLGRMERLAMSGNADAVAILAFQYGSEADGLVDRLPKLRAEWQRDAKSFTLAGTDLLSTDRWQNKPASRRAGRNWRIGKEGGIRWTFPDALQSGSFTIKARVMVLRPGGRCIIGMDWGADNYRTYEPYATANEWILVDGDGRRNVQPAPSGTFCDVSWQVTDRSTATRRDDRVVCIAINDKSLTERGQLTGTLNDIRFEANEGEMVVGGVELIRGR